MTKLPIMKMLPAEILSQHLAVLGKTGSGKTSTAKLLIEQVVRQGARVCVLDPIKSDWWGLTSSADGKREGLAFHILGGPRGHVPLHSSAGAAIAEVVASGQLPLSIIDMADFEPGGQAKFFTQFAPMLLKKMRGVVYLVLEEAHLFAPKERSGIGEENLSIHWSKTMATAGRSKGIRLVLVTQRTQALHNALLGSCDTLIAHRLTAPADQEPVLKWLKANAEKDVLARVSSEIASLKTGDGWICSGEARIFTSVHFERISTYDNTATPTGDGELVDVKTAAVDQDRLRAIIGSAVEEAKANDPRELKKEIAELRRQLAAKPASTVERVEINVVSDEQLRRISDLAQVLAETGQRITTAADHLRADIAKVVQSKAAPLRPTAPIRMEVTAKLADGSRVPGNRVVDQWKRAGGTTVVSAGIPLPGGERKILTALAQYPDGRTKVQVALLTGYAHNGGGFNNYISSLRGKGCLEGAGDRLRITDTGLDVLGDFTPLPTGRELAQHWLGQVGKAERLILEALLEHAGPLTKDALGTLTGYEPNGGGFNNALSRLRTLELIQGRGELRASEELFA